MIRVLLLVLVLSPALAGAQTSDEFFDSRTLHEVRLYIHSADLRQLREHYLEDTYVPGDFEWRGIRVRNVGVRVRGLASRSATKLGLRIDFNRYVAEQAFLGMSAVVLDNALKDPSFLRERTSMAFIKRMGQPAPRESFGRVYINGAYEGLYAFVETVDSRFLARELGDGLGYLFEHKFVGGFYGEFLGDDYEPYKLRFEPQTHRLESDYTLYAPIRELFREVNQEVDQRLARARRLARRSESGGHARRHRDVPRRARRIPGRLGDGEFLSLSTGRDERAPPARVGP